MAIGRGLGYFVWSSLLWWWYSRLNPFFIPSKTNTNSERTAPLRNHQITTLIGNGIILSNKGRKLSFTRTLKRERASDAYSL